MPESIFSTPSHSAEKHERTSQETLNTSINAALILQKILEQLKLLERLQKLLEQDKKAEQGSSIDDNGIEIEVNDKPGPQFHGKDQSPQLKGQDASPTLNGQAQAPQLKGGKPEAEMVSGGAPPPPTNLEASAADSLVGIRVGDYELEAPLSEIEGRMMEMPPEKMESLRLAFGVPEDQSVVREPITLSVDGEVQLHLEPPVAYLDNPSTQLESSNADQLEASAAEPVEIEASSRELEPDQNLPADSGPGKPGDQVIRLDLHQAESLTAQDYEDTAAANPEIFANSPVVITAEVDGETGQIKYDPNLGSRLEANANEVQRAEEFEEIEEAVSSLQEAFDLCFDGPGPHVIEGENYTITSEGGNLTVEAMDGRGTLLNVQDGTIQEANLEQGDLIRFEVGAQMMQRHQPEMQQLSPAGDMELGEEDMLDAIPEVSLGGMELG